MLQHLAAHRGASWESNFQHAICRIYTDAQRMVRHIPRSVYDTDTYLEEGTERAVSQTCITIRDL